TYPSGATTPTSTIFYAEGGGPAGIFSAGVQGVSSLITARPGAFGFPGSTQVVIDPVFDADAAGNTVFQAWASDRPAPIYTRSAQGVSPRVRQVPDPTPDGAAQFSGFGNLAIDGDRIALAGYTGVCCLTSGGVYFRDNGTWQTIAEIGELDPINGKPFARF